MSSKPQGSPATWLVTGCSTGIGRHIALAALARGHRVAVTARNPETTRDIVAKHPDQSFALALDVTERDQVAQAVGETERRFGGIDVLVNNAGYGYMAAVEEGEDAAVRAMFDTNYFGVVDMIKATLPGMRRRGSGHIINISSMTGLVANPPNVYYSSTKFALEALTEALSKEVAPFGIRVTAIEPGAIRTDWSTRSMQETRRPIEAYAATVGARKALIRAVGSRFPGDPARVADAVLMVSELEEPPLHLLLGRDVYQAYHEKLVGLMDSIEQWKSVTLDVGFPPDGDKGS
jgi:NAD(P)-dependent dehydrogenase (short-subunit alcohol dehydrogenase family)